MGMISDFIQSIMMAIKGRLLILKKVYLYLIHSQVIEYLVHRLILIKGLIFRRFLKLKQPIVPQLL
jgi:hypothetical protein